MSKWSLLAGLFFLWSCTERDQAPSLAFKQLPADSTGIAFANTLVESDSLNILDYLYFYNGGGLAVGDVNGDGLPDIYASANMGPNKLYYNKGNFEFEEAPESAGVAGNSSWNTGAVMVDVNADGLLDIYVCAVVGINGFTGHHELFINQSDGTFKEEAAQYGLDAQTYGTSAAFLDYDLDGDLDLYLLNHAVHTQGSFGRSSQREKRNEKTGDRLMRNDGGIFTDVSEEAGIYGGISSYGLGVAVADFNNDGYPDLYIGNDFHEDDYYYINNTDGTFSEQLRDAFGHVSRFSMGNDAADINNDGRPDLITLDMLPEEEAVVKASEGDENFQTQRMRLLQYGYHYQFSRNMLFLNQPDGNFVETALMSGVAATDWSWAALFHDFDQDGYQDLWISNGIPKRPNDLDFIRFVSSGAIDESRDNTKLMDQKALEMMPSGAISNKVFKGSADLKFTDQSAAWIGKDAQIAGATVLADLDADGDMDVISNVLNAPLLVYRNDIESTGNYIQLALEGSPENPFAIGAKAYAYQQGKMYYKELYTARGFQSSSEPLIEFGLADSTALDSLVVIWPDGKRRVENGVALGQRLQLNSNDQTAAVSGKDMNIDSDSIFTWVPDGLGLDHTHKEDNYLDFNRQKLLPYRLSDKGPAVAVGDWDNDGTTELFIGSSKFEKAGMYRLEESGITAIDLPQLETDQVYEEVAANFVDIDNDGASELLLGSAGADFSGNADPLLERVISSAQPDSAIVLPETYSNASVIAPFDFDADGDVDVFVGDYAVTNDFGKQPQSYVLINNNGQLKREIPKAFANLGMITDAIWYDFDADGTQDLIVVGEWMRPRFFSYKNGDFIEANPLEDKYLNGLWQFVIPFDIDADGDQDLVLGNWGLNAKFKASAADPLLMYYEDFDANGATETVLAQKTGDTYYPLLSLDELAGQMVSLKKRFPNFSDFAGKSIAEVMGEEALSQAETYKVHELASGYLRNDGGGYNFVAFGSKLQLAPLKAGVVFDFLNDGSAQLLLGGNYDGVIPFHGRFDSQPGTLIIPGEDPQLIWSQELAFLRKSLRHLQIIKIGGQPYLLAVFNNDKTQIYEIDSFKQNP
ncbi:VCBS repeat-containing protein [Gilvibacter sediminis]|uniref:VCBS repeat-containing protein n=1 Tax=Gilvibacter sediminis TaxID=379071 RepID=UPI00235004B8|nr:VCBS repeat-containing protein [Gilvibacter sediminis]MDC7997325.1 VCBS repeat-containing protein [Gilvibacter sediminis]